MRCTFWRLALIAGEPGDRLRPFRADDRAENLPAGARQPEWRYQPVTGGEQQAVGPEQIEDEIRQSVALRSSSGLAHMSP